MSSMAFIYFPLVIGLNIYCVTRMVDREFLSGRFNLTLAVPGMIMGRIGFVLLVLVPVLKIFYRGIKGIKNRIVNKKLLVIHPHLN